MSVARARAIGKSFYSIRASIKVIAHGRVRLVGPAFHVTVIFFELLHNRTVLTVFVASCCLNFTTDLFEPDGKFRVKSSLSRKVVVKMTVNGFSKSA